MQKIIIQLCLLLLVGLNQGLAQAPTPPAYQIELDKAERAYASKKYNTAAVLFQKVYPKIKEEEAKQKILFKIADSYRNSNNFKQALKWYEEVLNSKYPDPAVLYSYGQLLKNFERYDEANRTFYDYAFEVPEDLNGKNAMLSCALAGEWKANPKKFNIINLKELNTDQSDYAPFFQGNRLIWTSTRKEAQGSEVFEWTGQKYCDLFESKLSAGTFGKAEPMKALNSNYNEGVAWLDSAGSMVFFTQCNGKDGAGLFCKVLLSYFQNGAWLEPKPLPFNSDSFSIGHPAMTADGKRLYFSSDMPGGLGKKDIWYVSYDAVRDAWGKPVNAGPNVNSTEDELFPYIDEQNTLYYASKGRIGMGGLDLFKTADSSQTFKVAENLYYPINSGGDDFGISFIPKALQTEGGPIAYYTSNREGGVGDDDLYAIAIKPVVVLVKGKVIERESSTPLGGATVKAVSLQGETLFTIKTNDKGLYTAELPLKNTFGISASMDKYLNSAIKSASTLEITKDTIIEIDFTLELIPEKDVEITLEGIYYDVDKWDIRPDAAKILDSLALILTTNPQLVIELASHTDSRAPAEYNLELSNKRAKSCVDYLAGKGIAKDRMVPVGYGETKLVNDCSDDVDCSEEEHQQNRRTTFKILRTDYKPRR